MNVDEYLKKLDCLDCKEVSLENLKKLQSNHLKRIPFENIDMHMGKKITFSNEDSFDRFINKSRGGYCLQLNPLFGWLLKELGYSIQLVPSYPYVHFFEKFLPMPIHSMIIAKLNDKLYYVEVGTPRIINEPIELELDLIQVKKYGVYRFSKIENDIYLLDRAKREDYLGGKTTWVHQIKFKLEPADSDYFRTLNELIQTPEHPIYFSFSLVSIHTENSILILYGSIYIEIKFDENYNETKIVKTLTAEEFKDALKNKFHLDIDDSFIPVNETREMCIKIDK